MDEKSSYTYDNVRDKAQRLNIPIDTIGLIRDPRSNYTVGISALERISDTTGGNHRTATTVEGVQEAANTGIRWLQSTPVATFDLKNTSMDGRWHELGVRWSVFGGERSVRVLAPKGDIEWMWWAAGAAAAVLFGLLFIVATRRKPEPVPAPVMPQPVAPPAPAPVPLPPPAPNPNRGKTLSESQKVVIPKPEPKPEPVPAPKPATRKSTMVRIEFQPPQPGKPTAWLVAEAGKLAGRRVGIDRETFWIGAGENNQLVLEDETVSWEHACILFEHADLYLYDDSRNGTLVNGEKVNKERRRLNGGDAIQIGQTTFRLERR